MTTCLIRRLLHPVTERLSRHTWDTDMRGIMQLPMHGCLTPEACASSTGSHLLSTPLSCQVKASQNATPQAQHSGSQTHSDTAVSSLHWPEHGTPKAPDSSQVRAYCAQAMAWYAALRSHMYSMPCAVEQRRPTPHAHLRGWPASEHVVILWKGSMRRA